MLELQSQLEATQEQMKTMAESHDGLQQAHAKLLAANEEAERARATAEEKTAARLTEIAGMEAKLQRLLFSQKFDLLDMKLLQPEVFKGRQHEPFKPWAKKVKAFLNAKRQGFRKALDWAEVQPAEITSLGGMSWEHGESADEKLHDFLIQLCSDEAQNLIETPLLEGRGFEAWRLLTQRYSPCGGQYELDNMLALLNRKPVKDAVSIPGAISKLENDLLRHERRSGFAMPEQLKVPLLLQMLPRAQADVLKLRYAEGLTD